MLILDLWGISNHTVVVFGLGKNFLFKSILGCCEESTYLRCARFMWNKDVLEVGVLIVAGGVLVGVGGGGDDLVALVDLG